MRTLSKTFLNKMKKMGRHKTKKPKNLGKKVRKARPHKYIRKERKQSKNGKWYWKYHYKQPAKKQYKYTSRVKKTSKNGRVYWCYKYGKKSNGINKYTSRVKKISKKTGKPSGLTNKCQANQIKVK